MSRIGSSPKWLGNALLHNRQQLSHPFFRVRSVDKIEVGTFDGGEVGYQALVDAVRVDDDPAFGGLAKDLGQTYDRHCTRRDDVRQHLPGPNRRQLIDVANE
jgi:hypothetical protein